MTTDFDGIRIAVKKFGIASIKPLLVVTQLTFQLPDHLSQKEEEEFLVQYPNWGIIESDKPGVSGDYMRALYRLFEFRN